ncbi:hypothetical protein ACFOSS_12655 [Pseudaeromonas sharmana]|uniref:DGQHR domain-containing protein n=1 Tax=Pseudaeromonas sharmana TaxID=328412 RepID=A0ABV8CQY3_9GAMM
MIFLEYKYPAIRVVQSEKSKPLLLFGAPATEIVNWAGIPQKKTMESNNVETAGFQRTENSKRLEQLKSFYGNTQNVVQNSLICGLKKTEGGTVVFSSENGDDCGFITIKCPDLSKEKFVVLLDLLRKSLEVRIGNGSSSIDKQELSKLKEALNKEQSGKSHYDVINAEDEFENLESDDDNFIFDESHLNEFLKDVVVRHEIAKEIEDDEIQSGDVFLGFERNAIISFLLPITLVDGQHRLKGAILAAKDAINNSELTDEIATFIAEKKGTAEEAEKIYLNKVSRRLPVSLLMEDDPKEQVFQFVVINQKATPIGKSLLGTIISTSLTNDEMESVSDRLRESGIVLEEARAITWAAKSPESPFFNLVERGIQTEKKDLLQWNVMGSLIQIFRELSGGVLFHSKVDYAKRWKEKHLDESNIVDSSNGASSFDNWRELNGPWRTLFIVFWKKIRDEFSDVNNEERNNYWGRPRTSNLFNKISLTILAADFFKFLVTTKSKVDDEQSIIDLMDLWLEDVDRKYFDRDWDLAGVKKDSTGIRSNWSEIWSEYRDCPTQLPQAKKYRVAKK